LVGWLVAVCDSFHLLCSDINTTQSYEGNTPLHLAAYHKHSKCVEILLKNNVDVTMKNQDGQTALDYANLGGEKECCRLIQKASNIST